jgi:hypothetical protein
MAHITILSKDIRTLDGMYSLNDLHKAAGSESRHLPAQFLRNQQTKKLIAEIENYANSHSLAVNTNQGRSGCTWVCKELVYAYAMWISPKFNLQVIRAFDQAQHQEPEPVQQSLPAPIQDDEKLKLINDIAQSLGITESIVVVPAADIMNMVETIRKYQIAVDQLQTNPLRIDETIERVKNTTGLHFGEG